MAASEKELAEQLKEAGTRLLSPPSSVDKLLPLLDEVESCLERVEQSPSKAMQDALSPSMKALVAKELLGHSDPDVKVSVATCISEITRITAPDAPYNDDQMKEIFQLIVSSFEKLYDKSSRSYNKRTTILETVAKVRSCVVMLDLECDALILEMFQHFLKSVRDDHPENVFSSMETIMTLVLEESEDISPELLSSILEYLKKENKDAHPIAQRLGENVLKKCTSKVRPYLVQAMKTRGISLNKYSNVVSNICQDPSNVEDLNNAKITSINLANQVHLPNQSSEGVVEEAKETLNDAPSQDEISPGLEHECTMNNGTLRKGVEESEVKECLIEQKSDANIKSKAAEESNKSGDEAELIVKPQPKDRSNRKRGRKGNLPKSTLEPSEVTPAEEGKEAEKMTDLQESESKDIKSLHCEDTAADTTASRSNEKEADPQHPSSKTSENEAVDVASPSPSGDAPDESCLRKGGRGKKKEDIVQEATTSAENESKKESEAAAVSEVEADKELGGKTSSVIDKEKSSPGPADASGKDDGSTSDLDVKSTKQSGKKVELVTGWQDGKKRKGRGKAISAKDLANLPPKNEGKESDSSPKGATRSAKSGSSVVSSKRKRGAGKEKVSETEEYGEELVGSKIKVWWPEDKQFYKGVVAAFDSSTKKHEIAYDDGDVEVLNMEMEKWEFVKGDKDTDKGYVSDGESPGLSPEISRKKRTKTNLDPSSKQGKSSPLAKKVVGTSSSSRSKVTASKPGSKRSDDVSLEKNSKEEDSKSSGGFEDEKGGKSKDSKDGNKSVDETPRGGKSKDDDVETPKRSTKSKQQASTKYSRSKGKTARGGGSKSNTNSTGKTKAASSSTKSKEMETAKKSAKYSGSGKGKSSSSMSKSEKIETKSGKKRQRGGKK